MKMKYYSDTDSLYIDLSERPSTESLGVAPGIVLDFDEQNHIVGIDTLVQNRFFTTESQRTQRNIF